MANARLLVGLAALVATLTFTTNTQAADGVAKVRALYESGMAHYNLSEFDKALVDFKEGYRLKHDPAFLFNIGQCQRQLGDPAGAALTYRAYLRESPDAPNRAEVQKLVDAMDRAVAEQRAHQPPMGVTPPVEAPPPTAEASTTAQEVSQLDPALQQRNRTLRLAGIVTGAVGAGLLIGGGVFAAESKSAADQLSRPGTFDPSVDDRRSTFQTLDVVFFAAGGVALAAGVTLFVLGKTASERRRADASPSLPKRSWVLR
jgi:tetratricopeptide (TPR) repeat protein